MQAMTMDPSSDRSDPMTSSSSSLMNMELFCEEKTAQETVKSPATNSGRSLAIARFALNICSIDPYNFTKWTCKFSPRGILFMSVAVPVFWESASFHACEGPMFSDLRSSSLALKLLKSAGSYRRRHQALKGLHPYNLSLSISYATFSLSSCSCLRFQSGQR